MAKEQSITPVILCGGGGSRLWPVSREHYPKPFVLMENGRTLFKDTLGRAAAIGSTGRPVVVCNDAHRFHVQESLAQCRRDGLIILEPEGRNTAPAIALAANASKTDDLLLVMPSDHVIDDEAAFGAAVEAGRNAALAGHIVAFGIVPDRPECGYGYIEAGSDLDGASRHIKRFVEKPDLATARDMLASGGFFWNSGIFLLTAGTYLEELRKYAPEIAYAAQKAWGARQNDLAFVRPDAEAFISSPSQSIDYAVMEKTDRAAMVPLAAGWNDLGTWEAFYQEETRDQNGNVVLGDVLAEDSHNCYLHAQDRLLGVVGARDLAIVETRDAVLVMPRERAQDVKRLVEKLKEGRRREYLEQAVVYRPWGSFESLALGERFQVKKIVVKPGGSLSLQMHHHRAEHWVVVKGTAAVTIDGDKKIITENQSVYIPVGSTHKLENPGIIPLEIIEIQSGPYLGEDDIKRLEDIYGRS